MSVPLQLNPQCLVAGLAQSRHFINMREMNEVGEGSETIQTRRWGEPGMVSGVLTVPELGLLPR